MCTMKEPSKDSRPFDQARCYDLAELNLDIGGSTFCGEQVPLEGEIGCESPAAS